MKVRGWLAVAVTVGSVVGSAGVGAAAPVSSGYRLEQHECWIGSTHYGSKTTEMYQAGTYNVTQQVYLTSPAAKAHRVEWRLSSDNTVQYALGGTSASRDDVPTTKTFYPPTVKFPAQKLIFKVWDGATGTYCEDSNPASGPA